MGLPELDSAAPGWYTHSMVVCEICGNPPPERWYAGDAGNRPSLHDTYRTKIALYYAERAGLPGVSGRRACRDCCRLLMEAAQ